MKLRQVLLVGVALGFGLAIGCDSKVDEKQPKIDGNAPKLGVKGASGGGGGAASGPAGAQPKPD